MKREAELNTGDREKERERRREGEREGEKKRERAREREREERDRGSPGVCPLSLAPPLIAVRHVWCSPDNGAFLFLRVLQRFHASSEPNVHHKQF